MQITILVTTIVGSSFQPEKTQQTHLFVLIPATVEEFICITSRTNMQVAILQAATKDMVGARASIRSKETAYCTETLVTALFNAIGLWVLSSLPVHICITPQQCYDTQNSILYMLFHYHNLFYSRRKECSNRTPDFSAFESWLPSVRLDL
jgi:hypothetical protein